MFQKAHLSNGLRVITVPMAGVKTVTVLVMVATGSRYETPEISGISHFIEHMPSKGTKKRPTSLALSSLIDSIGGATNAFTGKEYTGFYIKAAAEHLELLLDVLADEFLNPLFRKEDIENERGVIIEEINMYEDQPQARVGEVFEELLYQGSPLSRRISGEKETVSKITREQMLDFRHKMYHSGSSVIGVAGSMPPAVKDLVEKYFGAVPKGQGNSFLSADDSQERPKTAVYFKKTDQAHLCVGVRAYPLGHPDRYVLAVLGNILGGNMSSRLFIEVREKKGLAYYISTGAEEYHDSGYLVTQAGLRLSAVDEAVKIILREYVAMGAKAVSASELARAKEFFKGRMVLRLEDSFNVVSMYTSQEVLEKKIETPEEILAQVEKVTAEDIKRVAADIFVNEKLNLAIVGPFKEEGKFSKILTI